MGILSKNLITCIEFGTSKISVLHGKIDKGGNPEVLGFASLPSDGCICKGDITNVAAAAGILDKALVQADASAGGAQERLNICCAVSGPGIESRQGEGNVMIYDEDRQIRSEHILEAVEKAESLSLPPDRILLNTFDSYFTLDSRYRVQNPMGHSASRLDASLHIISGDRNRVETFRSVLREVGFEGHFPCFFSGIGSLYAVLRPDEMQNGALVIDVGAGVTDYVLVKQDGILLSGVVPVGMDNVANDLSVGLELGIDQCRRFIQEHGLEKAGSSGEAFIEFPGSRRSSRRRIPVDSFEKIIHSRLNELFTIIRERIDAEKLFSEMPRGVVITGGGAMFPPLLDTLRRVMGTHVRRGEVTGISGTMNGLEPSYRYASLLGLLKFAADDSAGASSSSHLGGVGELLEKFGENFEKKIKDMTKVFKL